GIYYKPEPFHVSLVLSLLGSIISVIGAVMILLSHEKVGRFLLVPGLILQIIFAVHASVTFTYMIAVGIFFAMPFSILLGIILKAQRYL
ncbi:MAG: hypothetical protein ACREBU_03745, partial [Nitrososphaera sp.]